MAAAPVLLKRTLVKGSKLRALVRNGMDAITNADTILIALEERPKIGDSINLDNAMKDDLPEHNRWDYVLSVPSIGQLVGVEPHSARDSEISVVIEKKKQAITFLHDHLPPHHRVSKWYWVSHGAVRFSVMERARRRLDQAGIAFSGHLIRSFAK